MGVLNTEVEIGNSSDPVTSGDSVEEVSSAVRGDISVTMSGTDVGIDIHNSVVDVSLGLSVDVVSVGKRAASSLLIDVKRPPARVFSAGLVAIGEDRMAFTIGRASSGVSDKEVGMGSITSTTVTDISDEIVVVIGWTVASRVPSAPAIGSTMIVVSTSRRRFLFSSCRPPDMLA